MRPKLKIWTVVALLLLVVGCRDAREGSVVMEDELVEVRRVRLAEPDTAPLTRLHRVASGTDGSLLVLDRVDCRLRRYDPHSGALLGSTGRCGGGPGEFVMPLSVAADQLGRIYVSEASQRITRFRPDLTLDTTFNVEGFLAVGQLVLADSVLIGAGVGLTPRPGELSPHELVGVNVGSGDMFGFYRASPERFRPYWNGSWFTSVAALPDGRVAVAGSMAYPLFIVAIGADAGEPFGSPPPSYAAPTQPGYGAFAPPNHHKVDEWLASFTDIGGVWVIGAEDGLRVAVSHYETRPNAAPMTDASYDHRLDLYDNGRKTSVDVPLAGRIVGVVGGALVVLISEPPEGWTLSFLSVRSKSRSAVSR